MNQASITPNPYDVLEVSPGASNKEITIAFTMAIKRRKYSLAVIAEAKKSLIKPETRIIADYLRPIIAAVQRFKRSDLSLLDTPAPKLEFLAEFDDLDAAISDTHQVSQSDKRLGAILFAESPIQFPIQNNNFTKSSTKHYHSSVKKKR